MADENFSVRETEGLRPRLREGLGDRLDEAQVAELRQVLETTQEQWMEEWSHA